jgi:hypothetical protein
LSIVSLKKIQEKLTCTHRVLGSGVLDVTCIETEALDIETTTTGPSFALFLWRWGDDAWTAARPNRLEHRKVHFKVARVASSTFTALNSATGLKLEGSSWQC